MKKLSLLAAPAALLLFASSAYGQSNCRVLMPSIAASYIGSCKQGLADGKGEASGVDKYTGEFKKGLPDGEGTYFWQGGDVYNGEWKKGLRNGKGEFKFTRDGRDSLLTGIWKDDKYVGKETVNPYTIGYRNNVGRVTCTKTGDDHNSVKYNFSRSGESNLFLKVNDLMMQGSSGTENISNNFVGFEDVTFPFEGNVKFNAPNLLNTAILNYEVRLTINEPGQWLVTVYY